MRELGNLKELIPGSSTLRVRGSIPAGHLAPTVSDGQVLARSLSGPLIVRSAYGVGEVTLLSVDLDRRPLSTWDEPAQADLAVLLAHVSPPWRSGSEGGAFNPMRGSELNPTGVNDLQTQVINALDHFDQVPRPTHWTVLGWIAVLLLLLGPIDYLIVHKLLGKPHWTWVTFPCWVVLASVWSVSAGARINEAPLTSRQIDLVDVDGTLGVVRCRSWFNFYSPSSRRYRVESSPAMSAARESVLQEQFLGWVERPEPGFRGMYRSSGLDWGKPSYDVQAYSAETRIDNLPVRVWSSGLIEHDWEYAGQKVFDVVRSELRFEAGRLTGAFLHELDGELSDWIIAYESFAYYPRVSGADALPGTALPPHTPFHLSSARSNLLRGVLLGLTQTVTNDGGQARERGSVDRQNYDPLSRDPFRIARVLTFHDVTGGPGYTGLSNTALAAADLSHLLPLNRAILFGRIKSPATRFVLDGRTVPSEQHDTFLRVILPVDRKPRDPNAPPPEDLLLPRT